MNHVVIANTLLFVSFLVIAFFALRSVYLWYFKINESIAIQKESSETLKKILEKLSQ